MNINMLVSIDELSENLNEVLEKIEKYGEIIILKNNKPVYKMSLIDLTAEDKTKKIARSKTDLWKAMNLVLKEKPEKTMHAKDLAEEITARKLYFMKDGSKVKATQIRARAEHKPQNFQCLEGNYIKLIKEI